MNRSERRRESREKMYSLDDLISVRRDAYEQGYKEAFADKNKRINEGAKEATSHAFAYLVGITVKVMAEKHDWQQAECEELVEDMLNEYNTIDSIEAMKACVEVYSGMRLELED